MNKQNLSYLSTGIIQRKEFHHLLFAALQVEALAFANRLADMWLEKYPGDMEIQYIHARILAADGKTSEARAVLEQICDYDPEFVEAHELLVKLCSQGETHPSVDTLSCIYAMGKPIYVDFAIPDWSFIFRTAWQEFLAEQYEDADHLIQQVMTIKPKLSLAAILHQRIVAIKGDDIANRQLIHLYHQRFPGCLHFALNEADLLMADGNDLDAMELLYQCVTNDSLGLVAHRLWGANHRYASLWPDHYEMEFNVQVPSEIMSFMGLNTLPQGEVREGQASEEIPDAPEQLEETSVNTPEAAQDEPIAYVEPAETANTIEVVDQIFEKLSRKLKQPELKRSDGRFPVYVILSLKTNLVKKYGKQTFLVLDTELQAMAGAIRSHLGWGAVVVYPDDPVSMVSFGLTTLDAVNPWKIKNMLVDLDRFLAKKGEMIGALLLVGGEEIVPFHELPNPTDDLDEVVKSDNPYAATDGNYFVQEWPVGRIPDEAGTDAGFLLSQIRAIIANHSVEKKKTSSLLQLLLGILSIFKSAKARKNGKVLSSIGYSAAVWQVSSKFAYKPVEYGNQMLTSPPEQTGTIKPARFSTSTVGYFNLHGVEDGSEWYGQRETGDLKTQNDYPIALTPKEIIKGSAAPHVVFSEACYGGYIDGKTEDQSIALKFLGIGTPAFIGSTCVAYGSIDTPLIGADLLANYFWKNLTNTNSVGEAFIQAKLEFTREMDKRQGFLDGEDQKTLLSFIFYGDPMSCFNNQQAKSRRVARRILAPKVNIMSDDEDMADFEQDISSETLHEVKKIAEVYLPGLEELNIRVSQQQMLTDPGFEDGMGRPQNKTGRSVRRNGRGQTVVTVSKTVPIASKVHRHYLRARVDRNGHIDKVAVSR